MTRASSVFLPLSFALLLGCSPAPLAPHLPTPTLTVARAPRAPEPAQEACGVTVVNESSGPIAGVSVTLPKGTGFAAFKTDARGRVDACYPVADADRILVWPSDPCARARRASAPGGTAVTFVVTVLPRRPWTGRVVAEGRPVADEDVTLRQWEPAPGDSESSPVTLFESTATAKDGTFTLVSCFADGTFVLDLSDPRERPRYAKTAVRVSATGGPATLEVDRGATWRGRILDPTNRPIDTCTLFVVTPPALDAGVEDILISPCDRSGFVLTAIPPGQGVLHVDVHNHPLLGTRRWTVPVAILPKETRSVDLRWPSGEDIAGQVVDDGGEPVPHARVSAVPKGTFKRPNQFAKGEVVVDADATGRFRVAHLTGGEWELTGDLKSAGQRSMFVRSGDTAVRLQLPPCPLRNPGPRCGR